MTTSKSVFISYRRRDSSVYARWLAEIIEQNFGKASVFVDTSSIRIGEEWAKRIENSLRTSSVLIVLIGNEWLRAQDEHSRRRIDDENDWVRREIVYAVENGLKVIPILVSSAELPKLEALPKELHSLLGYQAFTLRDDHWKRDLAELIDILEQSDFVRITPKVSYPDMPPKSPKKKLTEEELNELLTHIPEWRLVARTGSKGEKRTEIMRTYNFASFEDAMHFMFAATRYITKLDHHPDWENIWKTITVWLTTWDSDNEPSQYDVDLALYLDELYRDYYSN